MKDITYITPIEENKRDRQTEIVERQTRRKSDERNRNKETKRRRHKRILCPKTSVSHMQGNLDKCISKSELQSADNSMLCQLATCH